MRIGVFKRGLSFLLDLSPILLIVLLMFNFFVGDLLKNRLDNYDGVYALYQENLEGFYEARDTYYAQYEAELITEEEYNALTSELRDDFANNNTYLEGVIFSYYVSSFIYFYVTFSVLYYVYNVVMHGQTLGRKLMKIELQGKVNWWTLFVREFLWKIFFWTFTMFIGILMDLMMISFSKKKKTLRDYFSQTYLAYEGINYPF